MKEVKTILRLLFYGVISSVMTSFFNKDISFISSFGSVLVFILIMILVYNLEKK